ncbi:MAG: cyclase family protein [Chloroflexi bacterium]|nr:cyclase family protein [Chloroflexota bacterium]MDA8188712.1 cyclase family protein [Dehalococcoidales bacterium]
MLQHKPARRIIYDISVLIEPGMPIYPGDPAVAISQHEAKSRGDLANVSAFGLGAHTGTHIDAPCHVEDGWATLQDLDLDVVVGPATVFEVGAAEAITARDLAGLRWDGVERVLFKTRNSSRWNEGFHDDFVYLAEDAARFLVLNTKVRLVGIDYLSVEKFGAKRLSTHGELLGRGIVVVEGLDLSQVSPGEYEFICLPLKLATCDGAPARAVLIGL